MIKGHKIGFGILHYHSGMQLLIFYLVFACTSNNIKPSQLNNAEKDYRKGLAYLQDNQLQVAEYYFQKSQDNDSTYAPAYEGLARIALNNHQVDIAWQFIQKSLFYQPQWISSILIKARIQYERKQWDLAIISLRQILEIYAKDKSSLDKPKELEETLALLAKSYRDLGKYDEAIKAIELAIKENPNAVCHQNLKKYLQLSSAAIACNPSFLKEISKNRTVSRAQLAGLIQEWFAINLSAPDGLDEVPVDLKSSSRFRRAILMVTGPEIIPIYPDGAYRPEREIKRAELALALYHLASFIKGHHNQLLADLPEKPLCADVPNNRYYFRAVQFILANQIIVINSEHKFLPDDTITGMEAILAVYQTKRLLDTRE